MYIYQRRVLLRFAVFSSGIVPTKSDNSVLQTHQSRTLVNMLGFHCNDIALHLYSIKQ